MGEVTLELTDFCPHLCHYCSTDAVTNTAKAHFLRVDDAIRVLSEGWDTVHLSGGEPLAHPDFYTILTAAQGFATTVIVHTNALRYVAFNPNVIDGIRVDAFLTVPDSTAEIHVLKRVPQGRAIKPRVHFSHNWDDADCGKCGHRVLRADGVWAASPCHKAPEIGD